MIFRHSKHLSDEQLSLLLDGRLSEKERQRVEAHLRACAICQDAYQGLRQTVALLRATPRVAVPRAFTLSEADVGRAPARGAAPTWTRWATALVGLMLLVVLGVDAFVSLPRMAAPAPREAVAPIQQESEQPAMKTLSITEVPFATAVVTKVVEKAAVGPTLSARAVAPLGVTPEMALEAEMSATPPLPEARALPPLTPTPIPAVTPLPPPPAQLDEPTQPFLARRWLRLTEAGLAVLFLTLLLVSRRRRA